MAARKRQADTATQPSSNKRRRSLPLRSAHKNESTVEPTMATEDGAELIDAVQAEVPEEEEPQESPLADEDVSDSDSDSDDAPEEVSKSAATQALHAQEDEKKKAIGSHAAKLREKRRAHDDRLRTQAERTTRQKPTDLSPESDDAESEAASEDEDVRDAESLPRRLPQSLLEAAGAVRQPTPPLEDPSQQLYAEQRGKRIVFPTERPPKDMKKGPLTVRVLSKQNQLLPPKSNRASRSLRERWLQGRSLDVAEGGKGRKRTKGKKLVRREVRKGFLRS